ncbi:MAG: GTPase HflX, partial [Sedimentitalea sp.]
IVVHVRDISHADTEAQARDVETILTSLGISTDRPRVEGWNKLDLLEDEARAATLARADRFETVFALSALTGQGIDALLAHVGETLQGARQSTELHLGFADGKRRAWLFAQDIVTEETQTETGFDITVLWTPVQAAKFDSL